MGGKVGKPGNWGEEGEGAGVGNTPPLGVRGCAPEKTFWKMQHEICIFE